MRVKQFIKCAFTLAATIACCHLEAAETQSRSVKGGDKKGATFTSTAPYTLTANGEGEWTFKTARASGTGWTQPGDVEGDDSASTGQVEGQTQQFAVELYGDMIPPSGGGSGPIDYHVTGYFDGEFSVTPNEEFILPSQTASFSSQVGITNTPATWTASPTWTGYSPITTPVSPLTVGNNQSWAPPVGAYTLTATKPNSSDNDDAKITVVGLQLLKKEYTDNDYVALVANSTLRTSPGDATTEPNMPIVRINWTGIFQLSSKMRYVVEKNITIEGVDYTYYIKGYEKTRSLKFTNAVNANYNYISGVAYNGGTTRTVDGTNGGITFTYKATNVSNAPTNTVSFNILGTNPSSSAINTFVNARQTPLTGTCSGVSVDMREYYKKMLYHESNYKQFNTGASFTNEPNWGYPHGWGIAQVDFQYGEPPDNSSKAYSYPEDETKIMWNWHTNINAGIGVLGDKFNQVSSYISQIRNWNTGLAMLSAQQLKQSYVVAYNGLDYGCASVQVGVNPDQTPKYIKFCYPVAGGAWGTFDDNSKNYWAVVDATNYPQ